MTTPHIGNIVHEWAVEQGLKITAEALPFNLALLLIVLLLSWLTFKLVLALLHNRVTATILGSKPGWDAALRDHDFFRRLSHIVPATIIHLLVPVFVHPTLILLPVLLKLTIIYLILATVWAIFAIFNTVHDLYEESDYAKRAPITGFIQVGKLLFSVIAILLVVAQLMDKSPILLLSGLGALTAIIILVFRDTILGLVAGINIVANRTVTNGDWIEMPNYNADGTVLAVGLTTVKVRNWDKTISTIPTYSLMSDSLKNWRGMEQSGGRRIKRAINIDITSVSFCNSEQLSQFKSMPLLTEHLNALATQLDQPGQAITPPNALSRVDMTNIGIYRKYVEAYLSSHPQINDEMTLLVRQLPPGPTGLPIELYCFCRDKRWAKYEDIQSDIFDHCIAILPQFNLRPYQYPTEGLHQLPS